MSLLSTDAYAPAASRIRGAPTPRHNVQDPEGVSSA